MPVPIEFGIPDGDLICEVVPNDVVQAKVVADLILAKVDDAPYDLDTAFAIKLSLEEALTNAIKHGNRNDPTKSVTIWHCVRHDCVVLGVADEGGGFHPDSVPDPTADENLERTCGRGLFLIKRYMTQIVHKPPGNEVWMLKLNPRPRTN
jgi:serine/threonine-protein kinase RsbW